LNCLSDKKYRLNCRDGDKYRPNERNLSLKSGFEFILILLIRKIKFQSNTIEVEFFT